MAEGDGGGGKVVLVVVLILLVLGLLCCGGVWLYGARSFEFMAEEMVDVRGSGVAATEGRDVPEFARVKVVGSTDVSVVVGDEQTVHVSADDNLLPVIKTEVIDGELVVSSDESYFTSIGVTVNVTVTALEGVSVTGSGDVVVVGVDAEAFDVRITGSGDVQVSGKAEQLTVTVAGSGDAALFGLISREAVVTVDGSGDVEVHATWSFDGEVRGSGDITYAGNPPTVGESTSGSGDIEPRGR